MTNTNSSYLHTSCSDNTADLIVKQGPFSLDDPKDHSVDVRISDGGRPIQTSITKLAIKVCVRFIQVSVCSRGGCGANGSQLGQESPGLTLCHGQMSLCP